LAQENYHHDNLKSELIQEGLKLLDKEGYEGFSLRKVAKACSASHAAPYRHFKNKDELILAIGKEIMHKFGEALQQAVDQYPDNPRYQLKEMGCAYIKFFVENPEYLRLMFLSDLSEKFRDSLEKHDQCQEVADKNKEDSFTILSETVKRYKAEIVNDADSAMDQDALILYSWGLVHGMAILIARKEFSYPGDPLELARKIIWKNVFLE
jgi:AcrR family transcriptional regulator